MGSITKGLAYFSAMMMTVIGVPIWSDRVTRNLYSKLPVAIPDAPDFVLQKYRKLIDDVEYKSLMAERGFNEVWSDRLFTASEQLLNVGELISSWRRDIITEDILNTGLSKAGFSEDNIKVLKEVTEFFPAPPDLVRFAVREVYTPEIRTKFGMDEDFPTEFLENAAKAGLPEQMAKDFWAAHWELPSPLQGNRMLHRGIINEDEHNKLLKALDIMPFWRTRMKDLSFNPLTRVDVRRMYGLDVLDLAGVNKAYRDIGYNEENAQAMTEFTVKFQNDENKGITRASVVSAFKKGSITEDELISYLKALRFSDTVVSFWTNFAVHEKVSSQIDDIIDMELSSYVEGVNGLDTLRNNLAKLGLPDTYIQNIVNKAIIKRKKKVKLPSKQDLIGWLGKNVIEQETFRLYMSESGYRSQDIDLYIEATLTEPVAET